MRFPRPDTRSLAALTCPPVGLFSALAAGVLAAGVTAAGALGAGVTDEQETHYRRAIESRAAKIVASLRLSDASQAARAELLIAEQYRGLRAIHDPHQATITALKQDTSLTEQMLEETVAELNQDTELRQFQLHRRFVSQLSADLTAEQVSQVKDGMTYGVLPATYAGYLQLLPNLDQDDRRTIQAFLIEAREYAMDAGSADEKHGWFRQYKGKINNYLSAAGYDVKAAQQQAQRHDRK